MAKKARENISFVKQVYCKSNKPAINISIECLYL